MSHGTRAVRTRRGLDLPFAGVPASRVDDCHAVRSVALMPPDHPGLQVSMRVHEGELVLAGQPLFVDRTAPQVTFTSPRAGIVSDIQQGETGAVQAVTVLVDGDQVWAESPADPDAWEDGAAVRRRLLAAGQWPALRSRPGGRIPHPDAQAAAIFVTAIDTDPLAGPIGAVLDGHAEDLRTGARALATLTTGLVHVCAGADTTLPDFEHPRVQVTRFRGPHPAGLVGTHMQYLDRPRRDHHVWYLGWQDAASIGRLAATGAPLGHRYVSLGGPLVSHPRWLRTAPGACIADLIEEPDVGLPEDTRCRVISGSVLSGRQATSWSAHVGRYHSQVCVVGEPGFTRRRLSARPRSYHDFLGRLWRRRTPFRPTTALHGEPAPLIPLDSPDRVMPRGFLPTLLLRALLVGDLRTAELLGCLEIEEEDLALCTYLCPSKIDYGALLRRALDELCDEQDRERTGSPP